MTTAGDTAASDMARLSKQWAEIMADPGPVPHWQAEIVRLAADHAHLRATGQWRTGGRTLLKALGVHQNEVLLCRGLAWLLTPDGWHGLGTSVLDGLLDHLGVPTNGSVHAVVVVEEAREVPDRATGTPWVTRADVVIRFAGLTVLIEAKVWAGEQERQADRLADGWAPESPTLVFLTRKGTGLPQTETRAPGVESAWDPLGWYDVASILRAAIAANPDCDHGAHEYLHTLDIYGGTRG